MGDNLCEIICSRRGTMKIMLIKFCEHYNHSITKMFASFSFPLNFLSHGKFYTKKFCGIMNSGKKLCDTMVFL